MSDSFEEDPFAPGRIRDPRTAAPPSLPLIAQYGLALVFVALATGLAFLVQHLISAPNISLIYVLPANISAALFGWGPSLLAVAVGVIAFDFFFTEPYYSLRMTNPSEPLRGRGDSGKRTNYRGRPGGRAGRPFVA